MNSELRWPALGKYEELIKSIADIAQLPDFYHPANFYLTTQLELPQVCQGDVFEIDAPIIYVSDDLNPEELKNPSGLWCVLGNTCDFARDLACTSGTLISPIRPLQTKEISELPGMKKQNLGRALFLPSWNTGNQLGYLVDFTKIVTINKSAFSKGRLSARLNQSALAMMHCVWVRYLCRDDGRFDRGDET